ncbi:MAG: tRNA (adenine(22)-N(1))-methyltransferase TrmK, partial [Clostridia bacterium]|nr:tRNA (adenine(22)-N(1))-methyltransferase TrmK [Clostridia bacterium]
TKAMLVSGKCERAIIADVSAKCLLKAQELLKDYLDEGRVVRAVSDGFDNLPPCDLALIAGMGGEEIVSILEKANSLPDKLVLQPMKNAEKVRRIAISLGYAIKKDYVFYSGGIFYDLICLEKGKDSITDEEAEFGRDNLKGDNEDFKKLIKIKVEKVNAYLKNPALSIEVRGKMQGELLRLKKYV